MDIKLKNMVRNPWVKVVFYVVFISAAFGFSFSIADKLTKVKNIENYNYGFLIEPALLDTFEDSASLYLKISEKIYDIEDLLSYTEKQGHLQNTKLKKDKDAYVLNDSFEKNSPSISTFLEGKKFSFFVETTNGNKYKTSDLLDLSENEIIKKFNNNKIYILYSYDTNHMESVNIQSSLSNTYLEGWVSSHYKNSNYDIKKLYLTMDDTYFKNLEKNFYRIQGIFKDIFNDIIGFGLIFTLLVVLLCFGAGRNPNNEDKSEFFFDYIFIEIKLAVLFIIFVMFAKAVYNAYPPYHWNATNFTKFLLSLFPFSIILISLFFIISTVRNFKSNELWKRSIIAVCLVITKKVIMGIVSFIKEIFKSIFMKNDLKVENKTDSIHKHIIMYIIASSVIMFFAVSFSYGISGTTLLFLIFELFLTALYIIRIRKLILLSNHAFDTRVVEINKSEKTKAELISNVSHDLKTPLTSIIGYIDLLSKEDLPDTAKDYVNVLERKSAKLKDIISDLFILSKSEGGNLKMDIEKIDLKKLIEQTLADMEDAIKDSEMLIKTKIPEKPVFIKTDGSKLYRVLQNLIDNSLKYSLNGTRIYIDLEHDEILKEAIFKIKNIASYEMNFDKSDITSRFVRGDESRTEDGSGLGLAIAESFTENLGGEFNINIDGDVFEVSIKLQTLEISLDE